MADTVGGATTSVTGTSASAAIVAGAAAVLRANDPAATPGTIVGRLARNADAAGTAAQTGNGRVNLTRAVADTGTAEVVPAGAAPLGAGGPFVGPYVVAAFGADLEGQCKSTSLTQCGTTTDPWVRSNLKGWSGGELIPTRVALTGGPVLSKTITVTYDHTGSSNALGSTIIIEKLTNAAGTEGEFTPSSGVSVTNVRQSAPAGQNVWSWTFDVAMTGATGTVDFWAKLGTGAQYSSGNSTGLAGSPALGALQVAKPAASLGNPDLTVTKTGPAAAAPGSTVEYTLTYTNKTGANLTQATNATLRDFLPAGLTYIPASCSGTCSVSGNTVQWDLGTLANGATGSRTLRATVGAALAVGTELINGAQIVSAETDANTADNSSNLKTTVSAGTAAKLAFTVQPSTTASGAAITPAVKVAIQDASGNVVTSSTANVTLAIQANPSSGTLSGTTTVAAVNGEATFSNLSIDKAGTGYVLRATSGTLTFADSNAFNITAGTASKLAFTVQPSTTASSAAITPAVKVAIQDASGNVVTSSTANVTLAIQTNPSSGTLSGTTTVAAVNGEATFSNLSIDKAGTGYVLRATSGVLTVADSNAFNITHGAANKIALSGDTTDLASGAPRTLTATIQDAAGNTVTNSSAAVAFAKTGLGSGTVTGLSPAVNATSGVATKVVTGALAGAITIEASSTGLASDTLGFTVVHGAANKIALSGDTTDLASGATRTLTATIQDAAGNTVTNSSAAVAFAKTGLGSGTVTGLSPAVNATSGVATKVVTGALPGGISITASSTGLSSDSLSFTVVSAGTTVTVAFGAASVQYTDAVTMTATVSPAVLGNGEQVTGTVAFKIGTTTLGSEQVSVSAGVATAAITRNIELPAGSHDVVAVFTSTNPQFSSSTSSATALTVALEDAFAEYTGDTIGLVNQNLTLKATVTDSAAAGYPTNAANPETGTSATIGEITKMWVRFDIYSVSSCGTGSTLSAPLYGQVTDTGTLGDGVGSAIATYKNSSETTVCVVASVVAGSSGGVNQWYRAPLAQAGTLTFYNNTGRFVTGGGWVANPGGGKGNFGFNARHNRSGQPQGQMVYVWRGVYNGVQADFRIKSNSLTSLSYDGTNYPLKSTLQGAATLQITRASDGVELLSEGNGSFVATVVDTGLPTGPNNDSFELSFTRKGQSSPYLYVPPTLLGGGNIVIHLK